MTEQLVWTPPEIEINGRTFKLRRLGILDVFKLGKIWSAAQDHAGTVFKKGMNEEMLGMVVISAIPYAEDQVITFLADLIGIAEEDFKNPDLFPLGSELKIIEALMKHEDVVAFFDSVRKLVKGKAFAKITHLPGKSTPSKPKRDGKTKKS